jgi:hypothetical protein
MASSGTTGWTWDPNREEHFYWSGHEGCWIYESGTKLYPEVQAVQAATEPRHMYVNHQNHRIYRADLWKAVQMSLRFMDERQATRVVRETVAVTT